MGGVQGIPPETALGVNMVTLGNNHLYGQMNKLVVHKTDDKLGFSRHGSVSRGVAQAFAVN